MANTSYRDIKDSLAQLCIGDPRPWLVRFSGGKDSTLLASLVFDSPASAEQLIYIGCAPINFAICARAVSMTDFSFDPNL